MIVLDASAVLEMVLQTTAAPRLMNRALSASERLHAPHLLDIEVTHVLRRLVLRRQCSIARAEEALVDLNQMAIVRHGHEALVMRIWELRDSLTAYDAAYVALAEALNAPLLTCDARIAGAAGHNATLELFAPA